MFHGLYSNLDVKIVSSISTFVLNTLTLSLSALFFKVYVHSFWLCLYACSSSSPVLGVCVVNSRILGSSMLCLTSDMECIVRPLR